MLLIKYPQTTGPNVTFIFIYLYIAMLKLQTVVTCNCIKGICGFHYIYRMIGILE